MTGRCPGRLEIRSNDIVRVEIVPNRGPASMGAELVRALAWAECADIASAFVTRDGLDVIRQALEEARRGRRRLIVRLVVGLRDRFTPRGALSMCLALEKKYRGRFLVRYARNKRFHWKLFALRKGKARRVYIGSANLTGDGLSASGELSAKLTAKSQSPAIKSLEGEFNCVWRNEELSGYLDGRLLRVYRERKPSASVGSSREDGALDDLLRSPDRPPPEPDGEIRRRKPRVLYVPKEMDQDAEAILKAQKTGWCASHWGYVCFESKQNREMIRKAGVVLLVERGHHKSWRLEMQIIQDVADVRTDDGNYFVAHNRVPYSRSLSYAKARKLLTEVGITWKKIKNDAALNGEQLALLCSLLHISPTRMNQLNPSQTQP
jgi:HKD family nuclease